MEYNAQIEKIQRDLGMAKADQDGKRGPKTDAAILKAADEGRLSARPAMVIIKAPEDEGEAPSKKGELAKTSEAKLVGVHNTLVEVIREIARRSDVPFAIIEGLRTAARQKELVKAGASKTQNSRHLTGHAVDLWPIDPETGKNRLSDAAFKKGSAEARAASDRLWADLRKIAATAKEVSREMGVQLEWGGDWGWDAPHFQLNRVAYPAR